jgi:hypothetical protein
MADTSTAIELSSAQHVQVVQRSITTAIAKELKRIATA